MRLLISLAVLAGAVSATTIRIDVGQSGLRFSPSSVTAAKGDILDFHFHAINHSVVMSDFASPCVPAATGGFFSGFMPVSGAGEGSTTFRVTVPSTDPIFFYCAQNTGSHCAAGMSGAVNPSSAQTLAAYQAAARGVSAAVAPPAPFGGTSGAGSSATTGTGASPSCSATSGGGASGYRFMRRADPCKNAGVGKGVAGGVLGMMGGLVGVLGLGMVLL